PRASKIARMGTLVRPPMISGGTSVGSGRPSRKMVMGGSAAAWTVPAERARLEARGTGGAAGARIMAAASRAAAAARTAAGTVVAVRHRRFVWAVTVIRPLTALWNPLVSKLPCRLQPGPQGRTVVTSSYRHPESGLPV